MNASSKAKKILNGITVYARSIHDKFLLNFRNILETDLILPAEKVHEVADVAVAHLNAAVSELRRLFLVEDFVDSLKFGVLLWCLTYVGSWFNGMTLIIIGKEPTIIMTR